MPGKTIRIISDQKNGRVPVRINGIGRDLPHNTDVAVTEDELTVLENSGTIYEVVGDASAKETKAAEGERTSDASPTVLSVQKPGGDFLPTAAPVDPASVIHAAPKIDQEPGGDNLAGSVFHGAAAGQLADEEARKDAAEKAEAARDGTAEPVVELRNTDPDMLGLDANNPDINGDKPAVPLADAAREAPAKRPPPDRNGDDKPGGGISVSKILEGTVDEVLKKAGRLDDDQKAALKAAEEKGQNRSGIVNKL